jgi:hypothetical protein
VSGSDITVCSGGLTGGAPCCLWRLFSSPNPKLGELVILICMGVPLSL